MYIKIIEDKLDAQDAPRRIPVDVFGDLGDWKALSWVRNKPTWTEPEVYHTLRDHSDLASSLLLLKSPDWTTTIALYPVSTLEMDINLVVRHGRISANARRVTGGKRAVWVVCAQTSSENEEAGIVERVVAEARRLVGSPNRAQATPTGFWDGIGVCSWEGLGAGTTRPTKDVLLSLVPSYPISTFLIDDGWQDVADHRGQSRHLHSFGPWDGFGAPLAEVVAALKDKGVGEVGVWMTLQGYWNGIDPESDLKDRYECQPHRIAIRNQPRAGVREVTAGDAVAWLPSPRKAQAFWVDWLGELKGAGIGFVKIDNQASYDALIGPEAEQTQAALWSGMLAAVQATWGSLDRVIMCMSHNERMLNGPGGLEFARPPGKLVYRNSDDFNLKYADAHQDFVRWNVYSSILTGHLALHLDFDMFSTTPQSRWPLYHALLRALGPGPLLVSDAPGEISDCTVLERLTARDSKGKLVGVKTDRPAMVPSVRWFWDNVQDPGEGPALVAVVPVPEAHGGLIAAWNARKAEGGGQAIDTITQAEVYPALADVGIADRHDRYVIWRVGLSSEARHEVITGDWPGMSMRIQSGNCELLVVAPVWRIGARRLAVLGMLDKLAPLAGLQIDADEGALTLQSRYVAEIAVLELGADEACEVLHAGDGAGGSVPVRREKVDGAELHYVSLGTDGPESFRVRLI